MESEGDRALTLTRRRFLLAATAAVGGIALAALGGCGEEKPAAKATAAPAGTKAATTAAPAAATAAATKAVVKAATIRYQYWGLDQKAPYEASLKEFMSKNPSITVNMEQIGFADYWTKLQTDFAAGTAADIFWNGPAQSQLMMQKATILPVDDLIKSRSIDPKLYWPHVYTMYQRGGKTYGLPKDVDTITYFYNKDLFAKAGAKVPTEPWTWNPKDGGEFLKLAQQLTMDKAGKHPNETGFDANNIEQYGFMSSVGTFDWLLFLWGNGADYLDKQVDGTKATMDSPAAVEATQFMVDLIWKYNVSPKGTEVAAVGNAPQYFYTGKVAMIPMGSWNLSPASANIKTFDWDVMLLPAGPKGRITRSIGLADSVFSGGKNLEAAWEAFAWLAGKPSQDIVAGFGVVLPGVPSSMEKFYAFYKGKKPDSLKLFEDLLKKALSEPIVVGYAEMREIQIRELPLAFNNQKPVADTLKTIAEGVNKVIAANK